MKNRAGKGIALTIIVFLFLICAVQLFPTTTFADSTVIIAGKIIRIDLGTWSPFGRKATLIIEAADDKIYNVHTGVKTQYIPYKAPEVGDQVSIKAVLSKGVWAAYEVRYK